MSDGDRKRGAKSDRRVKAGKASQQGPRARASYLALVRTYPLHPIRSQADLNEAIAVLDRLLSRRRALDAQEQDYFEVLSHEIERYEAAEVPMPAVSGAAMLRHLVAAREATLSQVAADTGISLSTLSSILKGVRSLNLGHVKALARYFGVQPAVFLD